MTAWKRWIDNAENNWMLAFSMWRQIRRVLIVGTLVLPLMHAGDGADHRRVLTVGTSVFSLMHASGHRQVA
eukprot:1160203-Pelagomonas_calceolata.AAC.1